MNSTEGRAAQAAGWPTNSLRLRILLAIMLWVSVGIGGIWLTATRVFSNHIAMGYHDELSVHIQELAALVKLDGEGRLHMDRPLSDPRYLVPLSGFYWQVTADGQPGLRSASMTKGKLDQNVAQGSAVHHRLENGPTGETITYGMSRRAANGAEVRYVIATDKRLLDETIASFTHELTLWLAVLALALLTTGLVVIAVGLRPLDRLALATARLRRGAAVRLEGDYPFEIAPLVGDLNAYIDHNRTVVEKARVEAGNLAHGLRTPLAVITDEAERLAQCGSTMASGRTLLEQAQIMVQQIEYRLARARSAATTPGPGLVSRPSEILPPIISAMRRLHPDRHFSLHISPEAEGMAVLIDPVDLSELLSILIDNAGKWALTTVAVVLERSGRDVEIRVTDDGPGVASEDLARAFEVGSRFDPATPGHGLGLAIARDIAMAYDLQLELGPRRDRMPGLEARVYVDESRQGETS